MTEQYKTHLAAALYEMFLEYKDDLEKGDFKGMGGGGMMGMMAKPIIKSLAPQIPVYLHDFEGKPEMMEMLGQYAAKLAEAYRLDMEAANQAAFEIAQKAQTDVIATIPAHEGDGATT